jgi:LasA protease
MSTCLGISPYAFSQNESGQPLPLFSQENFIYTPNEMLNFDIEAYLQVNAPDLVVHAEAISHWSGRTSISPKVILTLIEHQSKSISHSSSPEVLAAALVNLSTKEELSARIQDVATRLAETYYENLAKRVTEPEMQSLQALLQEDKRISTALQFKKENDTTNFTSTFFKLFPRELSTTRIARDIKQLRTVPAQDLLQLPYPIGQAWQTWGGTHTFTGSGSSPYSSLDFRANRNGFGTNTSNIWVSSASQGSAIRHSSCFVEVLASGGWSTTYYHLDNVQVNTNQNVSKNTRLANYADNLNQSLCDGGQSNGPHLHFSLKRNGVYASLDGVKLSGYEVHAGRSNYDSDCSFFWLGNTNAKSCNGTPILNNRPSLAVPDLSVSSIQIDSQGLNVDEPFSISSKLDNLGTAPSGVSRLMFVLSTDSTITLTDTALAELPTDELLVNGSAMYSAETLNLSVAGDFWLGACVVSVAGEINTANNCSAALPVSVVDGQGDSVLPTIMLLFDEE